MAQKLVDSKGEAVIEHGLLIQHLLGGDEGIEEHQFLSGVFDDLVISVERPCGERCRGILFLLLPLNCLRPSYALGIIACHLSKFI